MKFSSFKLSVNNLKNACLGGNLSHQKVTLHLPRLSVEKAKETKNPKIAAVLALFFPDKNNDVRFLLTKRASYNGKHSGQISFVGGKSEENESLEATALRETQEEVGILSSEIKIIRPLSEIYIPPSNFLVQPYIGYLDTTPNFTPNYEVAKIISADVNQLLDDATLLEKEIETSYMKKTKIKYFNIDNEVVWGATAIILSEIKDLLKENL